MDVDGENNWINKLMTLKKISSIFFSLLVKFTTAFADACIKGIFGGLEDIEISDLSRLHPAPLLTAKSVGRPRRSNRLSLVSEKMSVKKNMNLHAIFIS